MTKSGDLVGVNLLKNSEMHLDVEWVSIAIKFNFNVFDYIVAVFEIIDFYDRGVFSGMIMGEELYIGNPTEHVGL